MIDNNPISPLSSKPADEVHLKDKKTRVPEQSSKEENHDRVELSIEARMMSRVTSALNDETEIGNEKTRMIIRQVQDGTYQIPVDRLASALLKRLYKSK